MGGLLYVGVGKVVALNLLAPFGVVCRGGLTAVAALGVRASGGAGRAAGLGVSPVAVRAIAAGLGAWPLAARAGVAGRGAGSAGLLAAVASVAVRRGDAGANNTLNPAPFGRWTLRDKAAQRRLA